MNSFDKTDYDAILLDRNELLAHYQRATAELIAERAAKERLQESLASALDLAVAERAARQKAERERDQYKRQAADFEAELEAHATDRVKQRAENQRLRAALESVRRLLWTIYPCGGKYGDDGEMQAGALDFKRQPISELVDAVERAIFAQNIATIERNSDA